MSWWYVAALVWCTAAGFVAGLIVGLVTKPNQPPPAADVKIQIRGLQRADFPIDMNRISRN